jgi:hypothetical protein
MCASCYKDKRKQDIKTNEVLRNQADPKRKQRIAELKALNYKKFRKENPKPAKKCSCGNDAIKGSRYSFCTACSDLNSKARKIKYQILRKKAHPPSKIRENIKSRLKRALGAKKSHSVVEYLNCSIKDYMFYLESKFTPGMTWQNYGKEWHIDHIVPLSSDYSNLSLHDYKNTQPIWVHEHFNKTANENKKQRGGN